MEDENLNKRLSEHKNQLRGVEKLLQKDPANETLIDLQKDLVNIITATEKYVKTKSIKSGSGPSQTNQNDEEQKKTIPREWGVYKKDWKVGERCQVLYTDRKWYFAEITEIDSENIASLILLHDGIEHAVPCKRLRTYVPILREQINIDDEVKAVWEFDGLFYDAKVLKENEDGTFQVLFEKYNHKDNVKLEDIQLKPKKMQHKTKVNFRDDDGNIKDKFDVPEELLPNERDSEFVAQRKRKRIKQLKTEHKKLKSEEVRLVKQNSWRTFHKSMQSNKFRSHKFEKTKKSIFSTELIGNIGVTDPSRMTKNPNQRKYLQLKVNPRY